MLLQTLRKFESNTKVRKWTIFAGLSGLSFSAALFCLTVFLGTPDQDSSNVYSTYIAANNYNGWLNYAIWRGSLIPDFYLFTSIGIFFAFITLFWLPLRNERTLAQVVMDSRRFSSCLTIVLVTLAGILEIEFLGWAYELGGLLHDTFRPNWLLSVYNFGNFITFGNLQPNQDYPFFLTLVLVAAVASIRYHSVWKTLEILSLSMIPLPVYVYIFDEREFFVHFESQFKSFSFVTNFDVLIGSLLILTLSLLIERRKKIVGIIYTLGALRTGSSTMERKKN